MTNDTATHSFNFGHAFVHGAQWFASLLTIFLVVLGSKPITKESIGAGIAAVIRAVIAGLHD